MLTVDQLITLRRLTEAVPSPDGTWLAVAVQRLDGEHASKYVSDLWRVHLDRDEPPVQLTRGASSDSSPRFAAGGALLFLSNRKPPDAASGAGDEPRTQVWCLPAQGGEPYPLTDEPLGVEAFEVASLGERLVVRSSRLPGVALEAQRETAEARKKHGPSAIHYREMPVRFWDHWIPDAETHHVLYDGPRREPIAAAGVRPARESRGGGALALSPDGRFLALVRNDTERHDRLRDAELVLVDLEHPDAPARPLGHAPRTSYGAPVFSPDGHRLACMRHQRVEGRFGRTELVVFDTATGELDIVVGGAHPWDAWPKPVAFSADGRQLVCTADWRGAVPVFAVDLETREVARITSESSGGTHDSVHVLPGRAVVVGLRHTFLHPPEPFRAELRACATPEIVTRLSGFDPAEADSAVTIESVTVSAPDGESVQSWLVKPAGVERPPLVVWIHGGPIGAWADGWHWRWNLLVAAGRGFALALPNPRGSTGFGQHFVEGIWGNRWGAHCYDDLMAVVDALVARDDLDGARVAAMGGSFGGYMVNLVGGRTDRFACLVTHASIFDFGAFYGATDYPAWMLLEKGCTPHLPESRDAFLEHSPHRFVGSWKSPTLIVHGERDYRVPIGEALALFEWLLAHRVDAELVVFPDEGHWILRPRNIVAWYELTLGFLARHLTAPPSAAASS